MSGTAAVAVLDRMEKDEAFCERVAALKDDPAAVHTVLREAGYDATPEEIKVAFVSRYGSELSPEQLEALAGGLSGEDIGASIGVGFGMLAGIAAAMAFAAALS